MIMCMVSTLTGKAGIAGIAGKAGKAGIAGKAGKWAFFRKLAGKAVKPYGFLLLWLEKLNFDFWV